MASADTPSPTTESRWTPLLPGLFVVKACVWLVAGVSVLWGVEGWRVVLALLAFGQFGASLTGAAWIRQRWPRRSGRP